MKKLLIYIVVYSILTSCREVPESTNQSRFLQFKASLHPAFNELAEIVLSQHDSLYKITVLLKEISRGDSEPDTFYYTSQTISRKVFHSFDSAVIQKTFIDQPKQWEGCCDGMPVYYSTANTSDTSNLYFRNPDKRSDTIGYRITKSLIDLLKMDFNDSIVNEYLDDIESYMDESKFHRVDPKRGIDQLRMKKYGWSIQRDNSK